MSTGEAAAPGDDILADLRVDAITDEVMRKRIAGVRQYTAIILRKTDRFQPGVEGVVWEHGRRNMALHEQGTLAIVMPGMNDPEFAGLGIFDASPEAVRRIMDEDPGVQAGIFSYELYPVRGFPGASLPG